MDTAGWVQMFAPYSRGRETERWACSLLGPELASWRRPRGAVAGPQNSEPRHAARGLRMNGRGNEGTPQETVGIWRSVSTHLEPDSGDPRGCDGDQVHGTRNKDRRGARAERRSGRGLGDDIAG